MYHKLLKITGLVCAWEIADDGDIPIGNEVQNLIFSSELRCSNADTDNLARYGNRTICQNDLISHIQLTFKKDEEAIDNIRQKTLGPIPIATPAIPAPASKLETGKPKIDKMQ